MSNFTKYIDSQIQVQMSLGYMQDNKQLQGLRNIKSDYDYLNSKKLYDTEIELLKSLYKEREENSKFYDSPSDLYMQEIIELNILKPFIPIAPPDDEVIEFLKTQNIAKTKRNFKKFQEVCENKFGQKVNSQIILNFINS